MLQQGLQRPKVKYRSFEKIKRIMQYILHLSPLHRSLPPHQLWKVSELKWLRMEHDIVKASLLVSKTPQSFLIHEDKNQGIFYAQGRDGYSVPLLANPKKSQLPRLSNHPGFGFQKVFCDWWISSIHQETWKKVRQMSYPKTQA